MPKLADILHMDKADKLLARAGRREVITESLDHTEQAKVQILAAIDALGDIDENGSHAGGALRGALPELDRALRILQRMHGDENRAIANIARMRDS